MRSSTSIPRPASATRTDITARVAAHRFREPRVREIPRRDVELQSRATTDRRSD
jgi:hypothetical protein